ncbi:MAG: septum site-determining protein MinD, partial [Gammaproteobacteria bacterium]
AYQDAVARFLGEEVPHRFITREKRGLFHRLFGSKNKEATVA